MRQRKPCIISSVELVRHRKELPLYLGLRRRVFTENWGRQWAQRTPDLMLPDAGHFPQNTHGAQLAALILDGKA